MELNDLTELMEPLWKGGTVKGESVVFLEEDGFQAALLYKIDKVIELTSSDRKTIYFEGKDFIVSEGKIILTEQSSIPRIYSSQLYPMEFREGEMFGKIGGGYVRFSEGSYWHKQQLYVTYETSDVSANIPLPDKSAFLPETFKRLENKEVIRMVIYGDSISEGYNASGFVGAEPFMPAYGELAAEFAIKKGKSIWLKNTSLAGKTSDWGIENVKERVCQYSPDLVIFAFGMNDGTEKVSGKQFKKNMETLRAIVLQDNPGCEFIMIAPTVPNKEACLLDGSNLSFFGTQEEYAPSLLELRKEGTDILDMTSVHKALLQKKKFIDMTGNNINHPNDYLMRWYAQCLCKLLGLMD